MSSKARIHQLGIRETVSERFSGQPMKVDLLSFTQGNQKRISFMSQTVGLMADLDLETEHLRWMGDLRFVWGFLRGGKRVLCSWEGYNLVFRQSSRARPVRWSCL